MNYETYSSYIGGYRLYSSHAARDVADTGRARGRRVTSESEIDFAIGAQE